ncbi:MAG: hypothetical protein WCW56_03130 [Candidatus Paceibacterota bacterium]
MKKFMFLIVVTSLCSCSTTPPQTKEVPRFVEVQHRLSVEKFATDQTVKELGWGELKLVRGAQISWHAYSDDYRIMITVGAKLREDQKDALVQNILKNMNYADEGINLVGDYDDGETTISIGRHPQDHQAIGLNLAVKVLEEAGLKPVVSN